MRPLATVALAIRRQPDSKLVVSATAGSEYRRYFALHCSTGTEQLVDVDTAQVGEELGRQLPDEAADYSGSIEYRRHLVSVLSRRLLASAVAESEK
ncbi:MAG: hypothetical protein EON54_25695 [Alcaligenaceae bacterium]|nr:MAG: hypothetical protein EON54_25695 [Alcaligenaceae bacterium]